MRGTRLATRTVAFLTGAATLLSGVLATVHAQGQDQDPSARVARMSYLQGDVSFRPGTVDDWTTATLNYPLTSGDHLWTDEDARAELHVGDNAIRLAPQTAFEILDLDDNHLQIRLTQGSALIRIRTLDSDDNVEIDTPTGAVTLMRDGTYRVDVSADGATSTVTARNGDAEVTSNDQTVPVRPDETVLFTADGASDDVRGAPPMDQYDEWADARDRAEDQSVSAQYVSRDMTGYEDLDRNGDWTYEPQYGRVWVPTHVASDWAPYRYGRWAWVEPWGWTWIDDAQWGFAPFHYGRWAYVRDRWVWAPGVVRSRPVYAPALVVFVGGSNRGYNDRYDRYDSRSNVAWFPLAPNEVYRPAYHTSDRYVRRVNVTNVNITNINVTNVNVTNINYRNRNVNGAVTAVSQDQFAGSRRIGRGATVVSVSDARGMHIVGDGAPVTPTQQSILVRRQGSRPVSRPSEEAQNRQVVWKNTPPPRPATFASHEDQLRTTGDRPVAPLPISQTRGAPRAGGSRPNFPSDAPAGDQRRVPVTRPNINVQRYPEAQQAQPQSNTSTNTNTNTNSTTNTNTNTSPRVMPNAPQPNVNVRPAPSTEPSNTDRPAPRTQPSYNDRNAPRTDGPSTVNGSPNNGPAHTVAPPSSPRQMPNVEPTQAPRPEPAPSNMHPAPRVDSRGANDRPAEAPRAMPPQQQSKSPEQGEKPQASKAPAHPQQAAPARDSDQREANDRRRQPQDDKEKPQHDDKSPHHG